MTKAQQAKKGQVPDTPLSRATGVAAASDMQAVAASLVKSAEDAGEIDVDRAIEIIGASLLTEPVSVSVWVDNLLAWIPADRKASAVEKALEIAFQLAHRRRCDSDANFAGSPLKHPLPNWDVCTQALNLLTDHNALSPTEFAVRHLKHWGPAAFDIINKTSPKSPWDYERILHATIGSLSQRGFKYRWLDFKHRGVSLLLDRLAHEQHSGQPSATVPPYLATLSRDQLALAIGVRIYAAHVNAFQVRDDRFSASTSFRTLVSAWTATAASGQGSASFTSHLPAILLRECVLAIKEASTDCISPTFSDASPHYAPFAALLALDRPFVIRTLVLNGATFETIWPVFSVHEIAQRLTRPRAALNAVANIIKRSYDDTLLKMCLSKIPPTVRDTREFMYRLCKYNGETGEALRRRLESGCGWKWRLELSKYGLDAERDVVRYVTPKKRARRGRFVQGKGCYYWVSSDSESDSDSDEDSWDDDSEEYSDEEDSEEEDFDEDDSDE